MGNKTSKIYTLFLMFLIILCGLYVPARAEESGSRKRVADADSGHVHYPYSQKSYCYPIKINLRYGSRWSFTYNDGENKELVDSVLYSRKNLLEKRKKIAMLIKEKGEQAIWSRYPNMRADLYSYLRSPDAGEEPYPLDKLIFPIPSGSVIIDRDHYLWAFPPDNAAKWELYLWVNIINDKRYVSGPLYTGFRDTRPLLSQYDGSRVETFRAGDPYFGQGVIRFLEAMRFKVDKVEECVDFDPKTLYGDVPMLNTRQDKQKNTDWH